MTTVVAPSPTIGRALPRIDGPVKVTGTARYAAEHRFGDLAYAVLVKSPIAAGRVVEIGTEALRDLPGVLTVLTHENATKLTPLAQTPLIGDWRMPLSDDRVDYAGQNVAVVVADSIERARHAATLLRVEIEPDPEGACLLDQADPAEIFARAEAAGEWRDYSRGDVESVSPEGALASVEATYTIATAHHSPMELSATVAQWSGTELLVYDATQNVQGTAAALALAFGLPVENVHVVCPYVGGGFGCKGPLWPHTLLAVMAAQRVRRPVQLIVDRAQMFTSVGERPVTVQQMQIAAARDGRLRSIRHRTVNVVAQRTAWIEPCGRLVSGGTYACPNVSATHLVARAHVPPGTWMRGPGESTGSWALESAIDELAYQLAIDPLELRRRNHAVRDPMTGQDWSGKHLQECIAEGAERFGWSERDPAPGSMHDGDTTVGYGMAPAIFHGQQRPMSVRLRVDAAGRVRVATAAHDLGTGTYTIAAQVAADALGVEVEMVDVSLGDSALPAGVLAGGSATAASIGAVIVEAGARLRGRFGADADRKRIDWPELLGEAGRPEAEIELAVAPRTSEPPRTIMSFGAYFCEIAIEPLEQRVVVRRVVSVWDVGRVLNPLTARSQIAGSIVMAIGSALLENTQRDPRTGGVVNDNFADYAVPVNADVPDLDIHFLDLPDPHFGALGARGIGEIGMVGILPAIGNAVYHATGRRVRELPITPEALGRAHVGSTRS